VGKLADFIILDQNIFEINASQIGGTKVEATYLEGEAVYER
jgi:predicted amidohydrolase YtcJ